MRNIELVKPYLFKAENGTEVEITIDDGEGSEGEKNLQKRGDGGEGSRGMVLWISHQYRPIL